MRFNEFINQQTILREYRRDITARNYGDKLIKTLSNVSLYRLPDELYNTAALLDVIYHPLTVSANPNLSYNRNIVNQAVSFTKKTAPQVLEQLKPAIIAEILKTIENSDPTKNKQYTEWLARIWIAGDGQVNFEDLNRNDLLTAYVIAQKKNLLRPEDRDINRFKTLQDFETMIKQYDIEQLLNIARTSMIGYGNATVTPLSNVTVVIPHDLDASRRAAGGMGEGSADWCTKGQDNFNRYTRQGPLYILLPKNPEHKGERYQLHFPTNQFMDEHDDPVTNIYRLLVEKFPDLLNYFKKAEPKINALLVFADDEVLKPIIEKIKEYSEEYLWDTITDYEHNDEYWMEWQGEQARKKGYVDAEGDIDWERVHDDDSMNNYLDYDDELRRTYKILEDALNSTPQDVRRAANAIYESGDHDLLSITDTEEAIGHILQEELGGDDLGLSEWIMRNIVVRRNTNPADATAASQWRVSLRREGSR